MIIINSYFVFKYETGGFQIFMRVFHLLLGIDRSLPHFFLQLYIK